MRTNRKMSDAMIETVMRDLPKELARLDATGASPGENVYLVVNASVPPGIDIATSMLQNSTESDQMTARRRVDAMAMEAARTEQLFTLGMMVTPGHLLTLLRALGEDGEDETEGIEEWLAGPVPAAHIRVVLIDGSLVECRHFLFVTKVSNTQKPSLN